MPLYLAPPQFVSGCRSLYNVFTYSGAVKVFAGRIYSPTEQYPNNLTLKRRADGARTFELQPFELLDNQPADACAWGVTSHYAVSDVTLSDDAALLRAASRLVRRSVLLSATYARRPAHYSQGAWQAGYVGSPGRETAWQTAKQLPHKCIRFGDGAPPYFYAEHKSGATVRLVPYWHSSEPGNPYAYLTLCLREVWLSGDPRPVPLHVSRWIESRLSC